MSSLIIEPFAALFWALGIALMHKLKQLTQPAGLASLKSGTGTVLQGSVRFHLIENAAATCPFRSCYSILLIYNASTVSE